MRWRFSLKLEKIVIFIAINAIDPHRSNKNKVNVHNKVTVNGNVIGAMKGWYSYEARYTSVIKGM